MSSLLYLMEGAGVIAFIVIGTILLALGITQKNRAMKIAGRIMLQVVVAAVGFVFTILAMVLAALGEANGDFYAGMTVLFAMLLFAMISCSIWGVIRRKAVWIPLCSALLVCIAVTGGFRAYEAYVDNIPTVGSSDVLWQYEPYGEKTKVALPDEPSALTLSENLPRMDGATALYPVYSAFARAVYPKDAINTTSTMSGYVTCNKTSEAYENIISGKKDIIFVAAPSKEQEAAAKEAGVELIYTPIGREAFVFFVNGENPLDNITTKQIQDIYSGNVTRWKELGVSGLGDIRAFQRDKNSGSQSALERLMEGKTLIDAPTENVVEGMGGIIEKTADYKNYKNAIGYSFRFYATEMVRNNEIKLLSIDGAEPTIENIENGTYPFTSEFYAVTRSDASEETKRLLDWIVGEQGQELIEKTGYTRIKR